MLGVKVQLPEPSTTAAPAERPSTKISTVLPMTVVPSKSGVVSSVIPSESDAPDSVPEVMLVPVGAAYDVVSISKVRGAEESAVPLLPSIAVAVIAWVFSD